MKCLLELRGISKSFGERRVLSDLALSLHEGDIAVLSGDNGAGKSVLGRCIAGIDAFDAGTIIFGGTAHAAQQYQRAGAVEHGIAYIPQNLPIPDYFTVEEFLALNLPDDRIRYRARDIRASTDRVAHRYQMEFRVPFNRRMSRLDRSELQKVYILQALLRRAAVIIFDEPTSHLSRNDVEWFKGLVTRIASEGARAVLLIAHPNQIHIPGTKNWCLEAGKIADGAMPPDVMKEPRDFTGHDVVAALGHPTQSRFPVHRGETICIRGDLGPEYRAFAQSVLTADGAFFKTEAETARDHLVGIPFDAIETSLAPPINVLSNFAIGLWDLFTSHRVILRRDLIMAGLEEFAFEKFQVSPADERFLVKNLSGGNKQRLIIARCAARRPKVLVACNLFRGLDADGVHTVSAYIEERNYEGLTTVLISNPSALQERSVEHNLAHNVYQFDAQKGMVSR